MELRDTMRTQKDAGLGYFTINIPVSVQARIKKELGIELERVSIANE